MTKSIRSRKKTGNGEAGENAEPERARSAQHSVNQLMKLAADEFAATQSAQEQVAQLAARQSDGEDTSAQIRVFSAKSRVSAPQAAREAAKQLSELTNLKLDSVSAVDKKDAGWHVTVNLVELSLIPHSSDVLGAY